MLKCKRSPVIQLIKRCRLSYSDTSVDNLSPFLFHSFFLIVFKKIHIYVQTFSWCSNGMSISNMTSSFFKSLLIYFLLTRSLAALIPLTFCVKDLVSKIWHILAPFVQELKWLSIWIFNMHSIITWNRKIQHIDIQMIRIPAYERARLTNTFK